MQDCNRYSTSRCFANNTQTIISPTEMLRGLQQGLHQGEAAVIIRLLTRRFGAIAPDLIERIHTLSISQLDELIDAQLDFSSV